MGQQLTGLGRRGPPTGPLRAAATGTLQPPRARWVTGGGSNNGGYVNLKRQLTDDRAKKRQQIDDVAQKRQ